MVEVVVSRKKPDDARVYIAHEPIQKGDMVVVTSGHDDYDIGIVKNVRCVSDDFMSFNEVIAVINTTPWKKRCLKRHKIYDLECQLKQRLSELSKIEQYEMLAEKDPQIANVVNEYKELLKEDDQTDE